MRFAQNEYALFFLVALALFGFFVLVFRRKKRMLFKFAEEKLLNAMTASWSIKKQKVKAMMVFLAIIFSVFALMRPQWGFEWHEVKRNGLDIMIAMDVSKSMLANDIKPSRLERTKLAVKDLVKHLKGDRIGLLAFSGTSYLQCPLTVDYNGFLLALNDLDTNTIPRGGTSISSAMERGMQCLSEGEKKYKVLILITDGEDQEGNPLRLAKKAKKEGIKIFCIGIGTKEGELIQITDSDGKQVFLRDRKGNAVKSRLNEAVLKRIALTTDGAYVRSGSTEFGLDYLYNEKLASMEKQEIKAQVAKFYYERYQWPLALALILLCIEPLINDRKKRK